MSFAQVHYPFENADWFEHHFPGDFIVEYIGQTRGWFYTMHVLASAIFERPAFETCLSHGIVLGSDGQKMSKSLRNYPDVREVFDRDGADAMRWFLMSSPILRGGNLIVTEQAHPRGRPPGADPAVELLVLLRALRQRGRATTRSGRPRRRDPLDRYLLAKTRQYVETSTRQLDDYEVANACDTTRAFLDVLSNWYIRRSRERFWAADGDVDADAFDTLYTVLETVCRVRGAAAAADHRGDLARADRRAVGAPDRLAVRRRPARRRRAGRRRWTRSATSARRARRCARAPALRNRLPLSTLTVVVAGADRLAGFEAIVADELNVKSVRLLDADHPDAASYGVSQRLTVNARAAGPRLGKDVQTAIKGSKSGDWSVADDGTVTAGGLVLRGGRVHARDRRRAAATDSATGMLPRRRLRGARHRGDARARGRGRGPRPGPRGPAGPPRRRPRRLRPDRADRRRPRRGRRRGPDPRRPDRRETLATSFDVVEADVEHAGHRARAGLSGRARSGTALDTDGTMPIDLDLADAVALTEQLVDIESVSRNEQAIADAVEAALRPLAHLTVTRHGHTVVARTDLGRGERVVIAGHLDTVPLNDNLPAPQRRRRCCTASAPAT